MSGRGDSFANPLLEEIRATLAMFFKNIAIRSVDVSLPSSWTFFQLGFSCKANGWEVFSPVPSVHDPLASLQQAHPHVPNVDLLKTATVSAEKSCQWDPVCAYEPVFSQIQVPWHRVTFDKIRKTTAHGGKVTPLFFAKGAQGVTQVPAGSFGAKAHSRSPGKFTTAIHSGSLAWRKTLIKPMKERFYALPHRKQPLPLHRLSAEMQIRFKKALAQKAKTSPHNVQVKVVYDRVLMQLYQNFSQDAKGSLLCTPKDEWIGKRAHMPINQHRLNALAPVYLVLGTTLDKREPIQVVVPYKGNTIPGEEEGLS